MAAVKWMLALVVCLFGVGCAHGWVLTSYPNLEKFFYMEEDLMSAADVFLREEYLAHAGEDVHELTDITELLERSKHVHRRVGVHVERHLQHAVNVFHLVKRLARDWPLALQAIRQSKPCKQWQLHQVLRRLENIEENLPDEDVVLHLAHHLILLQHTANLSSSALKTGSLRERNSTLKMTTSDLFDLTRAAHLHKEPEKAVAWATELLAACQNTGCDVDKDGFNASHALSILASAYYKLGRTKDAYEQTEKLLKLEPDNQMASYNLRYYGELLQARGEGGGAGVSSSKGDREFRRYLDVCRGDRRQSPAKERRLKCYNSETKKKFIYEKVEIMNRKPLIVVIHGIFRHSLSMALKYLGLVPFRRQSVEYNYATPDFSVVAQDRTMWNWTQQANSRFSNLKDTVISPFRKDEVQVRSIGLEGMFQEGQELSRRSLGAHVGVYSTFLDTIHLGGHVAFAKEKVRIPPTRGSAVFHFSTMSKMMVCPAGVGINWMTHQTYREIPSRFCRKHDDLDFPEASSSRKRRR